jgi:hypothetical protein
VIVDDAVVDDVASAPQDDVVADPRERLDRVVLDDEKILADRRAGEEGGPSADVLMNR